MQDSTFVIISACVVMVLCVAVLGGLGFLLLRLTGRTISDYLGGQSVSEAIDSLAGVEKARPRKSGAQQAPKPGDLRTQADSLDFDAAVAKYRNNPTSPPPIQTTPASPFPNPTPQLDPAPPPTLNDKSRRRIRRESEDADGMLGGFMDEGGDDLPF